MPVLLFTSNNPASKNIAESLINLGFRKSQENVWVKDGIELIDTMRESVLAVPTDFDTDYLIVLSSHKSKVDQRIFTAHVPGNWGSADYGGEPKKLNIVYASRIKEILTGVKRLNDSAALGWDVSLEVDHHGPTCDLPIIFAEIGSTGEQWTDKAAGNIMAKAVFTAVKSKKLYETAFCVGGGHYPQAFNKLQFESQVAVGHILPKYKIESFDNGMLVQALEKSIEKVQQVFISREETNSSQKKKIIGMCEDVGIKYALI